MIQQEQKKQQTPYQAPINKRDITLSIDSVQNSSELVNEKKDLQQGQFPYMENIKNKSPGYQHGYTDILGVALEHDDVGSESEKPKSNFRGGKYKPLAPLVSFKGGGAKSEGQRWNMSKAISQLKAGWTEFKKLETGLSMQGNQASDFKDYLDFKLSPLDGDLADIIHSHSEVNRFRTALYTHQEQLFLNKNEKYQIHNVQVRNSEKYEKDVDNLIGSESLYGVSGIVDKYSKQDHEKIDELNENINKEIDGLKEQLITEQKNKLFEFKYKKKLMGVSTNAEDIDTNIRKVTTLQSEFWDTEIEKGSLKSFKVGAELSGMLRNSDKLKQTIKYFHPDGAKGTDAVAANLNIQTLKKWHTKNTSSINNIAKLISKGKGSVDSKVKRGEKLRHAYIYGKMEAWVDEQLSLLADFTILTKLGELDNVSKTGKFEARDSFIHNDQAKKWVQQVIQVLNVLQVDFEESYAGLEGDMTDVDFAVNSKTDRSNVKHLFASLNVLNSLIPFHSRLGRTKPDIKKLMAELNYYLGGEVDVNALRATAWTSLFRGVGNTLQSLYTRKATTETTSTTPGTTTTKNVTNLDKAGDNTGSSITTNVSENVETTSKSTSQQQIPVDGITAGIGNLVMLRFTREIQQIRSAVKLVEGVVENQDITAKSWIEQASNAQAAIEGKWEVFLPNLDRSKMFAKDRKYAIEYLQGAVDARDVKADQAGGMLNQKGMLERKTAAKIANKNEDELNIFYNG